MTTILESGEEAIVVAAGTIIILHEIFPTVADPEELTWRLPAGILAGTFMACWSSGKSNDKAHPQPKQ